MLRRYLGPVASRGRRLAVTGAVSRLRAAADYRVMRARALVASLPATAIVVLACAAPASAGNVELLGGTVRPVGHSAQGRAAVVAVGGGRRVLTLRHFKISPGPRVRVWLVPRGARGDGQVPRDRRDLGALKGSKGNQQYDIPRSVDLRKYTSVVFWCVPFTQTLARADLRRS